MRTNLVQRFLQLESASGIILFVAALLAMIWANSPWSVYWHHVFTDACVHAINEGLMTLFFLMVGLELKRHYLYGPRTHASAVWLPIIAALGGMLMPATIYSYLTYPDMTALQGWATPVATDIAFALGALTLLGRRVPLALKLFLLALAIYDDIGAIIIIAGFYSAALSPMYLALSLVLSAALYGLNRLKVMRWWPYLIVGVGLWCALFWSGVHPTLAGVVIAIMIPSHQHAGQSMLHRLEKDLHPWVSYIVMPLFALANAGFSWQGMTIETLSNSVVLGIVMGLFIGKQLGVFGLTWVAIRWRVAKLPESCSLSQLYGVALLCGIGFTMSLFLGGLAFYGEDPAYLTQVKLGVLLGSLLSGVSGVMVLMFAKPAR